jgi:small subunit ribosomal protein S17
VAAPQDAEVQAPGDVPVPDALEPEAVEAPAAPAVPAHVHGGGPQEVVHPKERRRTKRSLNSGAAQKARTPEERQAERKAERARKAAARRTERAKARAKAALVPSAPAQEPVERPAGNPKVRQGIVVSSKADKTITVRVDVSRRHRRYKKIVRSSTKLHAHDESNQANEGDLVRVIEARPLSRTKRWRLTDVLERAR